MSSSSPARRQKVKMSGTSGTGQSHVEQEYYGSPQRSISSVGARHLSDTTKEQTHLGSAELQPRS